MNIAYFDCFSGAAGDMIVGALVDAGVEPGWLREQIARLAIGGFRVEIEKVKKQGIAATRFRVDLDAGTPQYTQTSPIVTEDGLVYSVSRDGTLLVTDEPRGT